MVLHVDSEEITQKAALVYTMLEFMIVRLDGQSRTDIKKTKNEYCQPIVLIVPSLEMKNHDHHHHHHHHHD